eukprot:scaffold316037_cov17-Tisochrysis_lutea.AAC.1
MNWVSAMKEPCKGNLCSCAMVCVFQSVLTRNLDACVSRCLQLSRRTAENLAGGAYLGSSGSVLPDNRASSSVRPSRATPAAAEGGSNPPAQDAPP